MNPETAKSRLRYAVARLKAGARARPHRNDGHERERQRSALPARTVEAAARGSSGEGPPETTDARIRAAARRDLAPRGRRWWLPASLAASFVLAVLVVRSEFGTIRRPLVDESRPRRGRRDPRHASSTARRRRSREAPGQSPTASVARRTCRARSKRKPMNSAPRIPSSLRRPAAWRPHVGGPEREARAASEMPDEVLANTRSASTCRDDADDTGRCGGAARRAAAAAVARLAPPTPEAW